MTAAPALQGGLRQLPAMALAVMAALRLVPRPQPVRPVAPARYDLADPKAAEDAIVRDALCGAVQYRRGATRTGVQLILHGTADSGDVEVKLCHGGSVGMRVVVRVNGVELGHEPGWRFDAQRVAAAVLDGRDARARKPLKAGRAG